MKIVSRTISKCQCDLNKIFFFLAIYSYDLLIACKEIGEGKREAPDLLGDIKIRPISAADAYTRKLESKRVNNEQILSLLKRYSERKTFAETNSVMVWNTLFKLGMLFFTYLSVQYGGTNLWVYRE